MHTYIYICIYMYIYNAYMYTMEKVSFHFNPKIGNAKEGSNYHTIAPISHTIKVIIKILSSNNTSRCSIWI